MILRSTQRSWHRCFSFVLISLFNWWTWHLPFRGIISFWIRKCSGWVHPQVSQLHWQHVGSRRILRRSAWWHLRRRASPWTLHLCENCRRRFNLRFPITFSAARLESFLNANAQAHVDITGASQSEPLAPPIVYSDKLMRDIAGYSVVLAFSPEPCLLPSCRLWDSHHPLLALGFWTVPLVPGSFFVVNVTVPSAFLNEGHSHKKPHSFSYLVVFSINGFVPGTVVFFIAPISLFCLST